MRKVIILTSGVAAALVMGVGVVALDAQRGRGGDGQARPAIEQAQRGQRGPAFGRNGRFGRGQDGPIAGRRGPGRGGPAGFGPGLELTEDQQATLQDLRVSARDQSAPIADELRTAKNALHRAVYADESDNAAVSELAAKVASLEQQLAALHLANEQAIADVLTAEQKEIVRTRGVRGPRRGAGRR